MAPVDCYLAVACATAGRHDEAQGHLADARRLVKEWELAFVADWLDSLFTQP